MTRSVAAAAMAATLIASTASAQTNPCSLLTPAEVTSALGSAPSGGMLERPRTSPSLHQGDTLIQAPEPCNLDHVIQIVVIELRVDIPAYFLNHETGGTDYQSAPYPFDVGQVASTDGRRDRS